MIVGGLSSQFPLAPNATPVHDEPMQGEELRHIVETYERFGIHRAGTDVDRAVVDWMEGRFAALGLSTTRIDAPFDRYVTDSTLTADGVEVDHLPFFYEWTGSIDTTDVCLLYTSDAADE